MLGKTVSVVIKGSAYGSSARFYAPFYCGQICDSESDLFKRPVYIITNRAPGDSFVGKIIAIANKGVPRQEKIIVAPLNTVYYSPEIRSRLSRVRNQSAYKLSCLYEKSCGAIVYREHDGQNLFLLVKNRNGSYFGFPKGHIEIGETEYQTAVREVKEETNLDITIIGGFRETSIYRPFGQVKKMVVIFLAKAEDCDVKIQNSEIENYCWLTQEQVLYYLRYKNDIKMFQNALKFLARRDGRNKTAE